MKRLLFFGVAWIMGVALLVGSARASGTDASRFEEQLRYLRDEVFYWHESMWIGGDAWVWKPDWNWYMTISHDIEAFQKELARVPDSPCGRLARSIVIQDGPWVSATMGDMPGIERRWKEVIDRLPLTCDEF